MLTRVTFFRTPDCKSEEYRVLRQSYFIARLHACTSKEPAKRFLMRVATGMYLYRLEVEGLDDPTQKFVQVRKMLLLR